MTIRDRILNLLMEPTPKRRKKAMRIVMQCYDVESEEDAWHIVGRFANEMQENGVEVE